MNRINFYKIILPLLLVTIATGCFEDRSVPQPPKKNYTEKLVIDLSGRWKFSLGDKPQWKEKYFDDKNWEKINVPSSWENQGFHGYDGYAWYRKSFKLSKENESKDLYLVLGYIDDVDQTFINGNLIGVSGGFPNNYRTAYNAYRKYFIPKEYLSDDGENVIAVRVYDDELEGGIISGKIGIYINESGFEPDINLSGIWDFKTDDDLSFLNNDNEKTSSIKLMVPAHWDIQGYQNYDGFAWYRKTFFLSKDFDGQNMILLLGKIDDIDQTYVNGILVGSTGLWNFKNVPTDFSSHFEWTQERVYSVPQKLLKFGKVNIISVRVYDGFQDGGIYEGPIGLITQTNYKKYFSKE
jgi:sialate O-acetylesterase